MLLFIIVEGGVFWWVGWGRGSDYEYVGGLAWSGRMGLLLVDLLLGNGRREGREREGKKN